MRRKKPRALRPGDQVRLVSPASPIAPEQTERAIALLEGEGYRVTLGKHAFEARAHLAGSDQERAADLLQAFEDPEVAAVVCSRGGYGSARLLGMLDFAALAARPKLFAGFSDITTLHLALNRHGLPTLHAPMALTFSTPREPWVADSFLRALHGDLGVPGDAPRAQCVVGGSAEGVVTGGCLCLMTDSLGTRYPIQCVGKIVLIEDVDESPHRVDAMLTHLLNANVIQGAAGIVVGEMTRTDEKVEEGIGALPWREIVVERLAPLGIPMVLGFPFGHAPNMLSLGLGIRARLEADAGTLTYVESLCA